MKTSQLQRPMPQSLLLVLLLPSAAHADNLFPDFYDPSGVGGLGVQGGQGVGIVMTDAWTEAYGDLDPRANVVTGAYLYLKCSASPPAGATFKVGGLNAPWQDDGETMPASALEAEFSLAGCDSPFVVEITHIVQSWLDGTMAPNGLVAYGHEPSTDWLVPLQLDGMHAPYLQVHVSSWVDEDGDGWSPPSDCDDQDPTVYPGAEEVCNGIDDNCNSLVDEGNDLDGDGVISQEESFDRDGDGYTWCGSEEVDPDCDDNDPDVHPGAWEECDGIDNNCDGVRDEGCGHDGADNDLDGFREIDGDEDDDDPTVFPGAPEPEEADGSVVDSLCTDIGEQPLESKGCNHVPGAGGGILALLALVRRRRRS